MVLLFLQTEMMELGEHGPEVEEPDIQHSTQDLSMQQPLSTGLL